ncbi:MAG: YjbE family putative metal transport protein [Hyphomicrobium sp.]
MDSSFSDAFVQLGNLFSLEWYAANWIALVNIIIIDVTLAGDNAIVVGLAASRVAPENRARVIFWGIAAAVIMRIAFAAVTTQLLQIVGLTLAGGLLLLWVCWKMYRQLTDGNGHAALGEAGSASAAASPVVQMSFGAAVFQIALADISMSLDNVLAVAGVAKGEPLVLVIGLAIAIILMAVASHYIAGLLVKYPWISWIGLLIIVFVAVDMIYTGSHEVACKAYEFGCSETLLEGVKHRLGIGGG